MSVSDPFKNIVAADLIAATEHMPVGVSIVDEALRIKFWNRAFLEILQFPESLMKEGLPLTELFRFNGERGEYGAGDIEEMVETRVALAMRFEPHHFLRKRPDGRFIDIRGEVIQKDDGAVGGFVSLYQDVTREKVFEQELVESNRALSEGNAKLQKAYEELRETQLQLLQSAKLATVGQLAAGIAHEINNPIGFVHSNLRTLDSYAKNLFTLLEAYEQLETTPTRPEEMLAGIRAMKAEMDLTFIKDDLPSLIAESNQGINRVSKIIQDLKDFSHVDREDKWTLEDLHRGLDSTINVVWSELKCRCELKKEYGDLPPVECLQFELNQVFMNLLVNAAHAIENKGTITLRTGLKGNQVWLEVSDTGMGIAPENIERIFDPFFTTKPVGKGTGLGLSVSYSIIKKHHGRIEVESQMGIGTTFRIWLPLRQPVNGEALAAL